ncbi:MAG: zinc metallopeptidase [Planctomycetaceae bacterium]
MGFGYFDPMYFLFAAPAILLMMWAQSRIHSAYRRGMELSAPLSGAAAAQHILESEGVHDVTIEQTPGQLSDHYDPTQRVLRLSSEVYNSRTATAVGIAAHEAGHAIQHARAYLPLQLRNAAVPAAQYGPIAFSVLVLLGMFMRSPQLIWIGVFAYAGVFLFQMINLPVEFDASNRAKRHLSELGIVDGDGAAAVRSVLNAAAWTYVAATLQSLMTVLYYVMRLGGFSSRDD